MKNQSNRGAAPTPQNGAAREGRAVNGQPVAPKTTIVCEPVATGTSETFRKFAHKIAEFVGSPPAFLLSLLLILGWALTGPIFQFSDTWQLVINTGTTIVTFLMVFLIQNTQNRDAKAIHLKLDELIKAKKGARNSLVNLENLSDEELAKLQAEFRRFAERHNGAAEKSEEESSDRQPPSAHPASK